MFSRASHKGFTLIELMLYVSVASILLLAASVLLSVMLAARIKGAVIAEVEQEGTYVAQIIAQTARNSTSITSPSAGATGSSLTLVVPTGALSPTVFDLSAGALRITEGATAAVPLTNVSRVTVSGLTVQNLSRSGTKGTVTAQYTVTSVNPSGRNEYDYSKTFYVTATLR